MFSVFVLYFYSVFFIAFIDVHWFHLTSGSCFFILLCFASAFKVMVLIGFHGVFAGFHSFWKTLKWDSNNPNGSL